MGEIIQRQNYTLEITKQEAQLEDGLKSIYKITNKQTLMSYVGQTKDVLRRMKEHFNGSGSILLHDAFLDYGLKNFTFEVIQTDIVPDLADLIENHFIMKEDTLHPKGYNLRLNPQSPQLFINKDDCLALYGAKFVFIHNPSGLKAFTVSEATSARGFQQLEGLNLQESDVIHKKSKDGFTYYEILLQTDNTYERGQRYDLHLKYLVDDDLLVFA